MAKKNLKYTAEKIDELLTKADEQMATKTDLTKKVDKVDGKGLSTNDYTTAEKNKLASIQEGAQRNKVTSVRGALELYPQVGDVVISAGSIGLGDANTRLTSLENDKLDKSEKGATNGVASLDENGRVPSSQLPSYVDDVIDDYTYAQFPTTGETGKIYIAKDTNKTYRWSGSGYAEISASLALGETEQTAYSGAKGKKNAEDIATHTQQIANLDSNKLGKTEKAADSAKADSASALTVKSTTLTSTTERAITYHIVQAADVGSLPHGDNANAVITIPSLGGLKYHHQLGFTGLGVFHRKLYNKDVDATTPWKQVAFTDSTVANANSAATSSSLTVNGITSDVTYGTTAGIIQTTGDNPTGFWWNKFRILHQNSAGYFTELAMPFKVSSGLYYRAMETGTLSEWHKIPFASEIPTLALQGKTGQIPRAGGTAVPAGWYRIGVTTRTSQRGWTFRMMLKRNFNNNAGETYIIDAAISYASGAASNVYFTQVAGGIYNSKFIDKVRVTVASNAVSYIDLHISADCMNNIEYFLDGNAEAYAEGTIVTDETAATYEFSTVNGLASSHNITAPKFIGNLQGNADTATKLANTRKLWGQNFDGTANVNGNIILYNADDLSNGNASSSKLVFGGSGAYRGPYIEGVQGGSWGMKNLVFYQYNTQEWPGDYSKHYAAMVLDIHGRLGIGTTNPTEKLEVAGNIKATGQLNVGSYIVSTMSGGDNICQITNNAATAEMRVTAAGSARLMRWKDGAGKTIIESDGINTTLRTGNVGIGTITPTEKLEVAGNIKASGNVSANNGNFSGTLTVSSDATITGTMTATATYHSSDERLKEFEGDVEVDFEKLKALPKKYFKWKADEEGKLHLGTSAQAVREVFPELVSEDSDGYLSVNYANLSVVALAAVDKLAEQNAELERRLAEIETLLNIE